MPEIKRVESRVTYTAFAVETSPGQLAANPFMRVLDLNSYSDASTSVDKINREVMSQGRQVLKGAQTGKSTKFGYNIDHTFDNVLPQMCSFLFNKPLERGTSRSALATSTADGKPVTAFTATTLTVAGADAYVKVGDIIVLLDGVHDRIALKVSAATATVITFAPLIAGEVFTVGNVLKPSARIVKVGVPVGTGAKLRGYADRVELTVATALNITLRVGEWVFMGGAGSAMIDQPFYARVSKVTSTVITFDTTTRPVSTAADILIDTAMLFFGTFVCDGDEAITLMHMRYLGKSATNLDMLEGFTGGSASELSINASEKSLLNVDLSFMCLDSTITDSNQTAMLGAIQAAYEQDPINLSTDVVRQRLAIPKVGQMNTAAIHSFVQELNIKIANNLNEDTAMGYIGAVGMTAGAFNVTGNATVFFNGIEAINAVRCNCTVGMDTIYARKNSGVVIDIPELTLTTDGLTIERGQAVKLPLNQDAHKSRFGFTIGYTQFHWLPNEAMPQVGCDC